APAPFKKLESKQGEITSGQKQMEDSATAEDFEQALQQAGELSTKVDDYSAELEKIKQAKAQYEQALGALQPKLQEASAPAPFKKLESKQGEITSGQKQMEDSATA